jgi:hypothetical protein
MNCNSYKMNNKHSLGQRSNPIALNAFTGRPILLDQTTTIKLMYVGKGKYLIVFLESLNSFENMDYLAPMLILENLR